MLREPQIGVETPRKIFTRRMVSHELKARIPLIMVLFVDHYLYFIFQLDEVHRSSVCRRAQLVCANEINATKEQLRCSLI